MMGNLNGNNSKAIKNDENFAKPIPPTSKRSPITHVVKILTWKSLTGSCKKENVEPNKLKSLSENEYDKWPFYLSYSMVNSDYFDNNLLLLPELEKDGCQCTKSTFTEFVNPFFGNFYKRMMFGKVQFRKYGHINQTEALKQHCINFRFDDLFYSLVKRAKPTIYVSELVKGTKDTVGCTYSLVVKLIKKRKICQVYTIERFFEESGNDHLQLRITDYPDFDKLCICHRLNAPTLSFKKVYSIKVGKSSVRVLSRTIRPPVVFGDE